ncbi:MAG TPA: nucleoside recognition domain-containing protein, partial [Clostridia bacterium]|nr:nucleoside recognition domain-containing protein [Clostridia bacterium]
LTGFIAKEAVVSTLGVLYSPEAYAGLAVALTHVFTPLSAVSFMIFNLLTIPCVAAISTFRSEMKSGKWFMFALMFWFAAAWIVSFLAFNIGRLLGY